MAQSMNTMSVNTTSVWVPKTHVKFKYIATCSCNSNTGGRAEIGA